MEIKPCKNCLYYDNCIENVFPCDYDFPSKLQERLYHLFVEGYDCFIKIRCDDE
jgi:hypothetical protein